MQARFFCKTGALAGSEHGIGDDATIGRGPGSEIVLDSDLVSTNHARITFDAAADAYFLEDLDSRNGTRLDGVPVSGRARLGDLHVVTVAAHDFLFVLAPGEPPAPRVPDRGVAPRAEKEMPATHYEAPSLAAPVLRGEADAEPATRYEAPAALAAPALQEGGDAEPATRYEAPSALAAPALQEGGDAEPATRYEAPSALAAPALQEDGDAGSGPPTLDETRVARAAPALESPPVGVALEIRIPNAEPRRITLGDGRHILGRATDCSLPVDDRTLSRQHAAFVIRGERLTVTDLKSLNGTYVGELAVEKRTEIDVGQTVTLGDRVKVVRVDPRRAHASGARRAE